VIAEKYKILIKEAINKIIDMAMEIEAQLSELRYEIFLDL
jgi:hypothetical protein